MYILLMQQAAIATESKLRSVRRSQKRKPTASVGCPDLVRVVSACCLFFLLLLLTAHDCCAEMERRGGKGGNTGPCPSLALSLDAIGLDAIGIDAIGPRAEA